MTSLKSPPGPRGHWLVGSLREVSADRLAFFRRCFDDYGDAASFRMASRRGILLSHPDDIERVLVTENRRFGKNFALRLLRPLLGNGLILAEGDAWLRQRRLIQPAFSKQQIESYAPAMVGATRSFIAGWQSGDVRNIHSEMMQLTMDIAGRTLLGVDATGQFGGVRESLEGVMQDFLARFRRAVPIPLWLPTPGNLRLKRHIARLNGILQNLIEQRRASSSVGGDFLSLLIRARDEGDGSGLSDKQLRDEVMTMFLAGHDTTANALSWTWWLLGQNPDVQQRLRQEVDAALSGREATPADVPRLPLCENVLRESLRLYPPAYVVGRRALEDCTIGKYSIRKGTNVLMSSWVVHRDPRWYDRPDEFLPDRWADGLLTRIPKYAYFPFGGGPRACIGNNFAMQEGVLVIATMAQQLQLSTVTLPPIKLLPAITLKPAQPLEMKVQRR
ncbi:MAG: cytochrome P450 [Pirellulaceae bacterium]